MKRQVDKTGGKLWFNENLIDGFQDQLYKAVESQYKPYGSCIISGCKVSGSTIAEGIVYLDGKIMPFAGASGVSFPKYLKSRMTPVTAAYDDGHSDTTEEIYEAILSSTIPAGNYITISAQGGKTFRQAFQDANNRMVSDAKINEWNGIEGRTANNIESAIGSIEIGGRNLIRNGNFENGTNHFEIYPETHVTIDAHERLNVYSGGRIHSRVGKLVAGVYTLQFEQWGNIPQVNWRGSKFNFKPFTFIKEKSFEFEGGKLKEFRIELTENDTGYIQFETASAYRLDNIKLEKGNKATDWTPSLEDVKTRISTAQSTAEAYALVKANKAQSEAEVYALTKANEAQSAAVAVANIVQSAVNALAESKTNDWVAQIIKDEVTAVFMKTLNLTVGNQIQMGEDATIHWDKVQGAQAAIDSIEIGGKNLIRNGNFANGTNHFYIYPETHVTIDAHERLNVYAGGRVHSLVGKLVAGVYTLRFEQWSDVAQIIWRGSKFDYKPFSFISDKVLEFEGGKLKEFRIELAETDTGYIQFETASAYRLDNIKLEKGNKATDWTPSPEDKASINGDSSIDWNAKNITVDDIIIR